MDFAQEKFGDQLRTSHPLKLIVDYNFEQTNTGSPGQTFMPANQIQTYISSTLFRAKDWGRLYVTLGHELFHARDADSGFMRDIYQQFKNETALAIFEIRAYNHSIKLADEIGRFDLVESQKSTRAVYYLDIPKSK